MAEAEKENGNAVELQSRGPRATYLSASSFREEEEQGWVDVKRVTGAPTSWNTENVK